MKKLLLLIFLFYNLSFCYSQNENDKFFNEKFKEIVFSQIFENIEVNIPMVLVTPGFFMFYNMHYINNNALINDNSSVYDEFSILSNSSENELSNLLNCSFISSVPSDSIIQLRARFKNKILYNLTFESNDNNQILSLSFPDKSTERIAKYENGNLKSLKFKKLFVTKYTKINNENDSIITTTNYNTSTKKYSTSKLIQHNNVPIKRVFFKKSSKKESEKIKKIINYNYQDDGKLLSEETCSKNGYIRSTIQYFYKEDLLSSIINNISNRQNSIFYKHNGNRISEKSIISNDKQIDIKYEYDNNNHIKIFQICKGDKNSTYRYLFEYDIDEKLISIKKFKMSKTTSSAKLKQQYLFNYHESQILKSLIVTDRYGNINKEIMFEINYLNKN